MGGAVKGEVLCRIAPEIALGTKDDVDQGRLLPTASVDQYAATLACWLGISDSDLGLATPNIGKLKHWQF